MDRSYITPPWLLRHFIQVAEDEGIPYQIKQPGIGGTDAGSIHQTRAGVPRSPWLCPVATSIVPSP